MRCSFDKINSYLWAKKGLNSNNFVWLPLKRHLFETGQITALIWEHWLSKGQKLMLEKELGSIQKAKDFCVLISTLHDIGKASPAFQTQKSFINSNDLDMLILEKLEYAGFKGISCLNLQSPKESSHALAGQYILKKFGFDDSVASIVGAHHGKPVDNEEQINKQEFYECNYYQSEDKNSKIYTKWETEQKNIIYWALELTNFESVSEIPVISKPLQVLISGIVIMSDWIASNESYFPLISIEEEDVFNPDDRVQIGWGKWQKSDLYSPNPMFDPLNEFLSRFSFKPNNLQKKVVEVLNDSRNPGILIIEAPMGVGKTEAALFSSEILAYKNGRSGLYFCLPTQATSDGVFLRVHDWLKNLAAEEMDTFSLRLSHGKANLNDDFRSLSTHINTDGEVDANLIVNEWFAGRKTSTLDDFVVGTVDNFLLVSLKQKHLALRHLGFSKKVLIIDEVHAYDAYMNQYLSNSLSWMASYGVPVIILSATLPIDRRKELIKSYLLGKGLKSKDIKEKLEKLNTFAYPLITYNDGNEIKVNMDFESDKSNTIKIKKIENDGVEDLVLLIKELYLDEGVVGVVLNTVKRAQEVSKKLIEELGEDSIELLHSSFIASHRIKKEKELMSIIGKNSVRPRKKIIIGTQVIEQSLDIDFDVLITDLAPMDLLIQRMGRLHRHERTMPKAYIEPCAYILGTSQELEFDEGSKNVYGEYLLARAQYFLSTEIKIPDDISKLVQNTYDDSINLDLSTNNLQKYEAFKIKHDTIIKSKKDRAKSFLIENPSRKKSVFSSNSLVGFLNNDSPNQSEERVYAQVRDIEATIEIIALQEKDNGYGFFDSKDDISNMVSDKRISKKIASQTLRLPRVLSAYSFKNFDKTVRLLEDYNREKLYEWQNIQWLKGSLGIIFDKNGEFEINGIKLKYEDKLGLRYERM